LSRSADLDFTFAHPVEPRKILSRFIDAGIHLARRGEISYVLDEDGMFDWLKMGSDQLNLLMSSAQDADPERVTFGISVFLDEEETGGDLLIHPGRKSLSFLAEINRRNISNTSKFCDLGWYIHRLVPVFEPMGLLEIEAHDLA
jgi:hypothetical protein